MQSYYVLPHSIDSTRRDIVSLGRAEEKRRRKGCSLCLPAGTFMHEGDGIGVEDLPSEPARVHKPGVLRRARERICSAQGRIGVCFVMVVLALFILWPLSLALTAAAQGPLPQRESLGPALAPDPDLPLPDQLANDGRYVAIVPYPAPAKRVVPSEESAVGYYDTLDAVDGLDGLD